MDFTGWISRTIPRKCSPLAQIRRGQEKPGPLLLVYFMPLGTFNVLHLLAIQLIWSVDCLGKGIKHKGSILFSCRLILLKHTLQLLQLLPYLSLSLSSLHIVGTHPSSLRPSCTLHSFILFQETKHVLFGVVLIPRNRRNSDEMGVRFVLFSLPRNNLFDGNWKPYAQL